MAVDAVKCADPWRGLRCQRDLNHDGMHRSGLTTWGFREPTLPEWRQRAEAAHRAFGMVAVKELR